MTRVLLRTRAMMRTRTEARTSKRMIYQPCYTRERATRLPPCPPPSHRIPSRKRVQRNLNNGSTATHLHTHLLVPLITLSRQYWWETKRNERYRNEMPSRINGPINPTNTLRSSASLSPSPGPRHPNHSSHHAVFFFCLAGTIDYFTEQDRRQPPDPARR